MKRNWSEDELSASWLLLPSDLELLVNKHWETHLGFGVLLKFFQQEGRFPDSVREIPKSVIEFIANQVHSPTKNWRAYSWDGATIKRHRKEIREWFGFRESSLADHDELKTWLRKEIIPQGYREEKLRELLFQKCRLLHIEPPTSTHIQRLIQAANQQHEDLFCESIFKSLNETTLRHMSNLLQQCPSDEEGIEKTKWQIIKEEPGRAGLESVKAASLRLSMVREIELPSDLFKDITPKLLDRYAKRAVVEEPYELRRHADQLKSTLMAAYLFKRKEDLTDHLIDLLVETVHKMGKKAERQLDAGLGEELQKAPRKMVRLYRMAKASVQAPKGLVEDVIFPEAPEQWLNSFIKEVEAKSSYKNKVRTTVQRSYRSHYRRMLPALFNSLEFRCTNITHKPVMDAIKIIKDNLANKGTTYPQTLHIPLKGVVPSSWMPLVLEDESEDPKINRIAYEICALRALREQLRCREIWVVGSRRYRDPEEDLPKDFEERRQEYYDDLGLPVNAKSFSATLRDELTNHLTTLDKEMPTNPKVNILVRKGVYRISISPFEPQPEPKNLVSLKREISQRWSGTSLLDVLKETDLRVNFTHCFKSGTEHTRMDKMALQRRLLLCLFGLGTNTGIKSMLFHPEDDYKELQYVRRRFISIEGLRQAIAQTVNATLTIRLPQIWGESTTACGSDSKQFGAWDQNLLTEWHLRYGGRGVMVYWHVEKNAACIYSQFKKVSSSEVASMIQGVLRHCTEMEIDRQYVDSHGQSMVGFSFCRLLGFELMPRLKGISRQKLFKASTEQYFPNLDPIMAVKAINWELIEEHYDSMIKYVVALKTGLADAESILRRFTRNNLQHPIYKAFVELGKAIKTIFICRYLRSEELRREIHEGLNVVESWNSTNGFIYYGKRGEISSNRSEDQEIGLLSLHLLQASLVYINTLMIQQVLKEPEWIDSMESRDLAALSPLITQHISPYGRFELDLNARLSLSA